MRRAALSLLLVGAMSFGCTPRPWNFDETDRISEVMARDEDPVAAATVRSVSAPELPDVDVIPYPRPVFVRPREPKRSPSLKGKRATTLDRAKHLFGSGSKAKTAARSSGTTRSR